jgi:hypothetical protein
VTVPHIFGYRLVLTTKSPNPIPKSALDLHSLLTTTYTQGTEMEFGWVLQIVRREVLPAAEAS